MVGRRTGRRAWLAAKSRGVRTLARGIAAAVEAGEFERAGKFAKAMKGYLGGLSDAVLGRIGNDILAGMEAGTGTRFQNSITLAMIRGQMALQARGEGDDIA